MADLGLPAFMNEPAVTAETSALIRGHLEHGYGPVSLQRSGGAVKIRVVIADDHEVVRQGLRTCCLPAAISSS
jgi:hypothetical protein